MALSPKALAVAVDGFAAHGLAAITETPSALTISRLRAEETIALERLLSDFGWSFQIVDRANEHAERATLTDDYAPFILTIDKPIGKVFRVITAAGLVSFLLQDQPDEVWEVATLGVPFSTMGISFVPWGASALFTPAPPTKNPRLLVRDHTAHGTVTSDVRRWLLREPADGHLWDDAIFRAFADLSAQALMRALSCEIESDGKLMFKGPPRIRLEPPKQGSAAELGLDGYNELRAASVWVYETNLEAERRHGLFIAEFSHNHPSTNNPAAAFASVVANVLDGARLAYQLSLSDLTREAIKAQGDLRKAVADDTAKLAYSARQISAAVAAAVATCVGLVAAKIGTTAPHWVLQLVAVVAAMYVASVIANGWIFMNVQTDMRQKWRTRLYRFIPEPDYEAMVLAPAGRAQTMFVVTAIAGGVIATFAVMISFLIFFTP